MRRRKRSWHTLAGSAPPGWLEPILRPIERLDRWRRRINPIRRGGLLGLERVRFRGEPVRLRDGTLVKAGDLIGELHFDNRRARELAAPGWQSAGIREARLDLAVLAAWSKRQPVARRPVAYHAETLLGAFARRAGFEVRVAPNDFMHRLRAWYLRALLARWSPQGRARLDRGHRAARLSVLWLSEGSLRDLYGATKRRNAGQVPSQ